MSEISDKEKIQGLLEETEQLHTRLYRASLALDYAIEELEKHYKCGDSSWNMGGNSDVHQVMIEINKCFSGEYDIEEDSSQQVSLAVEELTEEDVLSIQESKMDSRHNCLNQLLMENLELKEQLEAKKDWLNPMKTYLYDRDVVVQKLSTKNKKLVDFVRGFVDAVGTDYGDDKKPNLIAAEYEAALELLAEVGEIDE